MLKRFFLLTLAALAFALLLPILSIAHEDDAGTGAEGYEVTITPSEAIRGDTLPIEALIVHDGAPATGVTVTLTLDRHEEGVSDQLATEEREPGRYVAKYRFTRAGEYEVHVEWQENGEPVRTTAYVNVLQSSFFTPGTGTAITAGALVLLALAAGIVRKRMKSAVIQSITILVIAGLGYSLYVTFRSGAASAGVITCVAEDECYLTAHVHAYVPIEICGEELRLPIETGSLSGAHTHEEKNTIHWHDRARYDKTRQDVVDLTPFTLGAFFDAIEIPMSATGIAGRENGDSCNGTDATLKMFVNGKPSNAFGAYRWRDKDVIFIAFDARTAGETEAWLRENPITFPALGRG